jgi:uncharacterized protein (DUF2147 family)
MKGDACRPTHLSQRLHNTLPSAKQPVIPTACTMNRGAASLPTVRRWPYAVAWSYTTRAWKPTRTPSARGSEGFRRLALPIVVVLAAAGAADPAILGHWLTESGHGVIEIVRCENAVCGRIVGIDRTPSEPMPTDVTGQSQCGLTIISGATQAEDNAWYGKIVDPRDGATYHEKLRVDSDGRLNLRGYIGIPLLGSTQVWSRFTGRLAENCRFG